MDFNGVLYFVIFASFAVSPSFSSCERKLINIYCNYTVTCEGTPTAVTNPSCSQNDDPYVTFIIHKSINQNVATRFFATTNFDARVQVFKAYDNHWDTLHDSAFRYYYKTVRMEIVDSHVTTIKSRTFTHLNYLQYLNLSNNQIQTIEPDGFLISESRSNNIIDLDLSNNELTSLDDQLSEFTNLNTLHLQNNKLTSLTDDAFASLKNLSYLYLQNNQLTALNLTLTNLKKLTVLDLSHNKLLQLLGFESSLLVSIKFLNLSHNELTLIESNSFSLANDLETVDLSYNYINTTIENVLFKNNAKLQYLDLFSNLITGLQKEFLINCDITFLNIDQNNITGDLLENTFDGITNVVNLNITSQYITGIRNKTFSGMESLLSLNLSNNIISTVDELSFLNTTMQTLDLSHNFVPNLNFLKYGLNNLTHLYLSNNNITVIPKFGFQNQSQMIYLDISMNKIVRIEENSLPLYNLQYLYVQGNNLQGILKRDVFSPAKYLRFLDISNFNLTRIESMALVDLPVLVRLNISNNEIESIDSNNFIKIDNMFSLDLSFNKLTKLSFHNSTWNNLKALYINNNQISNISEIFSAPCELMYLDASHNAISDLSGLGFGFIRNLTSLHLNSNNIKIFNNPSTNSLKSLVDLRISSNQLSNIKLSYFPDLLSVDLSNNSITSINSTLLQNVKHLQSLDLSMNNITSIIPGTFIDVTNLKLLNLSSNNLTKLRYGSLKGLHKTEVLDISRNKITDLDVYLFHECDELSTLIIDYNKIKSFDVEHLLLLSHKLKKLSLGGNPIACEEIIRNVKAVNSTFLVRGQVEVTSLNKIYHEDNVHGIKCGDVIDIATSKSETTADVKEHNTATDSSTSSIVVLFVFCTLILVTIGIVGVVMYIRINRNRVTVFDRTSRASLELSGTEFQRDLLS